MHRFLAWMFPVLLALMLLCDFALWAGINKGPVGPEVLRSAQKEAPLALLYTHAGTALYGMLGMDGWATGFAEARAGQAYADVDAVPEAAMDIVLRHLSWPMRFAHSGVPWVLLLWGLWYWRRPRQLHTIRRR